MKVDHMCQGASCGDGVQGHMMAVEFQAPTMQRWAAAIAAVNKTRDVLFQNCGVGCPPLAPPRVLSQVTIVRTPESMLGKAGVRVCSELCRPSRLRPFCFGVFSRFRASCFSETNPNPVFCVGPGSPASGDGVGAQPWGDFCPETSNMWRSGGDTHAMFDVIVGEVANLAGRGHLAGPGGWNFPDSLEVRGAAAVPPPHPCVCACACACACVRACARACV